jgi:hypothetical protein
MLRNVGNPVKKPQISIRLSGESRRLLGREVVRLTINPVLLSLSIRFVDWSGRDAAGGKLRAFELVARAQERFPELPLSWAVEGYIALLIGGNPSRLQPFSVEPYQKLEENVLCFEELSPADKIRVGQRWKRELELLRRAR